MNKNSYKFIELLLIINVFLLCKIASKNKQSTNINNSNVIQNNSLKLLKEKNHLYKEFLQLYIEDREKFYIKGREYLMKKKGKIYNDSNIVIY